MKKYTALVKRLAHNATVARIEVTYNNGKEGGTEYVDIPGTFEDHAKAKLVASEIAKAMARTGGITEPEWEILGEVETYG